MKAFLAAAGKNGLIIAVNVCDILTPCLPGCHTSEIAVMKWQSGVKGWGPPTWWDFLGGGGGGGGESYGVKGWRGLHWFPFIYSPNREKLLKTL